MVFHHVCACLGCLFSVFSHYLSHQNVFFLVFYFSSAHHLISQHLCFVTLYNLSISRLFYLQIRWLVTQLNQRQVCVCGWPIIGLPVVEFLFFFTHYFLLIPIPSHCLFWSCRVPGVQGRIHAAESFWLPPSLLQPAAKEKSQRRSRSPAAQMMIWMLFFPRKKFLAKSFTTTASSLRCK